MGYAQGECWYVRHVDGVALPDWFGWKRLSMLVSGNTSFCSMRGGFANSSRALGSAEFTHRATGGCDA